MLEWIQRYTNRLIKREIQPSLSVKEIKEEEEDGECCQKQSTSSAYTRKFVKKVVNGFCDDEDSFDENARFDIARLNKTISDGCKWIQSCGVVKEAATSLYQMQQEGVINEAKVRENTIFGIN